MYWTTDCVRPCLDKVINTSAADLRHIILCGAHHDVMAENNRLRSSFLANSSHGNGWLHNLTSTYNNMIYKNKIPWNKNTMLAFIFYKHKISNNIRLFTCTNIFWSNIRLSLGVKSLLPSWRSASDSGISGRSKNRYKHLTKVEGIEAVVITWKRLRNAWGN